MWACQLANAYIIYPLTLLCCRQVSAFLHMATFASLGSYIRRHIGIYKSVWVWFGSSFFMFHSDRCSFWTGPPSFRLTRYALSFIAFQCDGQCRKLLLKWRVEKILIFHTNWISYHVLSKVIAYARVNLIESIFGTGHRGSHIGAEVNPYLLSHYH